MEDSLNEIKTTSGESNNILSNQTATENESNITNQENIELSNSNNEMNLLENSTICTTIENKPNEVKSKEKHLNTERKNSSHIQYDFIPYVQMKQIPQVLHTYGYQTDSSSHKEFVSDTYSKFSKDNTLIVDETANISNSIQNQSSGTSRSNHSDLNQIKNDIVNNVKPNKDISQNSFKIDKNTNFNFVNNSENSNNGLEMNTLIENENSKLINQGNNQIKNLSNTSISSNSMNESLNTSYKVNQYDKLNTISENNYKKFPDLDFNYNQDITINLNDDSSHKKIEESSIPKTRSQAQREKKQRILDPWKDKVITIQVLELIDKFLSDLDFGDTLKTLRIERGNYQLNRNDQMPKSIAYGNDAVSLRDIVNEYINRKNYLGSLSNDSQIIIQQIKDLLEIENSNQKGFQNINDSNQSGKYLFVGNNKVKPPLHDSTTFQVPPMIPMISGYPVYIPPTLKPPIASLSNVPLQSSISLPQTLNQSNEKINSQPKQPKSRRKKNAPAKRALEIEESESQDIDILGEDTLLDIFPFEEDILGTILSAPHQYAKNIADKINTSLDLSPETRREEKVAEELAPEIIRSFGFLEEQDNISGGKRKRLDDSLNSTLKKLKSKELDQIPTSKNLENLAKNLELDVFNDLPDNEDDINDFLNTL